MEVFTNKMGKRKAVSYHPVYDKNLYELLCDRENYSERDILGMAHDLLIGLAEIAKTGMHGDLTSENVLVRRARGQMEAVVSDFESFSLYTEESGKVYLSIWTAPETIRDIKGMHTAAIFVSPDQKKDVWPLGVMLYCIFQKPMKKRRTQLPWLHFSKRNLATHAPPLQTQEILDLYIDKPEFPPAIATLLKGMLQVDPAKRWTAQQALDYFEKNLLTPK